jgi:hypothetical protein
MYETILTELIGELFDYLRWNGLHLQKDARQRLGEYLLLSDICADFMSRKY